MTCPKHETWEGFSGQGHRGRKCVCAAGTLHRDEGMSPLLTQRSLISTRLPITRLLPPPPAEQAPRSYAPWELPFSSLCPVSRINIIAHFHVEIFCPGVSLLRLRPKMQTFFSSFVKNSICFHSKTVLTSHPISCPWGSLQLHLEFSLSTFPF